MIRVKILKDIGIVTVQKGREIKVYQIEDWLQELENDCWWHRMKRRIGLEKEWD
jgi:hypothetical protein